MPTKESKDDVAPWSAVCPHCAGQNTANATVCRHCFGPLMTISNSDPMGSISARGDVFNRAAKNPAKPIVIFGVWAIFGPLFVLNAGLAFFAILDLLILHNEEPSICGIVGGSLFATLFGAILFKTTRNYYRCAADEEESESKN